ncbi:MAG TPA: polysaccharide lyase [Planctomycetota bacterium]|nr:polysaccharide lyase [Planctomycetota bacterium]
MNSSLLRRLPISLLTALLLAWAAPVSAEVLWRGDFECGDTSQWPGAPKGDGVKVVTEPVREGKYALRIDGSNAAIRGKLDRIEFQHQPKAPGTAEGTERYFGWSVFLPKKFTDGLHCVGYFETRKSWSQLMSFEAKGEDIVYSTRVPYALRWTGKGKLTAGRWHDFAVHVLWSRDAAKGFVEVWFDGEKVVPRAATATLKDENEAFFQLGFMRETNDVPETIVIDHVIEATTLEEVTPPPLKETAVPVPNVAPKPKG